MDTPGILWPKFEDPQVGMYLAFIGSMNDEIMNGEELACELLDVLQKFYPDCITQSHGKKKAMPRWKKLPAAEAVF